MKTRLIASLLLIATLSYAQQKLTLTNPESVISDGHFLYVTNMGPGNDPAARHEKGYITKMTLKGQVVVAPFNKQKLNNPKGTAIIGNILYVADLNCIVGVSLKSGKTVRVIDLSHYGTSLTNDLAVKDNHSLFVSATDIGKVFLVDLTTGTVKQVAAVAGANGICYDPHRSYLYVGGVVINDLTAGHLFLVDLSRNNIVQRQIGNLGGAFDGLALLDEHTLLISDWKDFTHAAGVVVKLDLTDLKLTTLLLPPMYGPADFFVQASDDRLIIPIVKENRVAIYRYSGVLPAKAESKLN